MQYIPEPGETAECRRAHAVREIVQQDYRDAERGQETDRQVDQGREHNHGGTEGPKGNQQDGIVRTPAPVQGEPDDEDLQQDQPQAAKHEELRQLRFCAAAIRQEQTSTHTGGEQEDGGAEMGDPASQEDGGRGCGHIQRRLKHGSGMEEVANVVQSHDDHDGSTQGVKRREPSAG